MRIVHTSDWHLGRTFHGVDLLDDQRRALSHLAALVAEEAADAVVVAGDVYDRSVPSADAVQVYDEGLAQIAAAGAQIVVTSGNHDSATRLGAGSSFAAAGGLHLRTSIGSIADPVILTDAHGEVAVYGIPYLEPDTARRQLGIDEACGHTAVLEAAMDRVRADLAGRDARSVVVAHAFVSGAAASGSERSISVGGVETVAAEVFSGADYVALGHLHSPQRVTDTVRYSGSLLPYSFGERTHRKAVWVIDLDADGVAEVRKRELPLVRGLSSLRGTLEELLTDDRFADAEDHYVEAALTDDVRPLDAMRRLRERFPHAVHVQWDRPHAGSGIDYRSRVRGRTDAEIILSFIEDVRDEPTKGERAIIERALRDVVGEPEADATEGELALFALDAIVAESA
ncbi:exonuclease sbcCD subunit D [Gordonia paraffinivorans]|uniref:Nuclease SbcCD subunit D n=1 Tax=Gordonia paraffinivorans NBRC 108238 TaxID=1223543 RepID=A0ABQ0IQF8_9ACTN|nr:exonuclease SbcCD subunit D [Gordonia paraffinivorans]MBY4574308.1 exonuclease sbcCD subunit D [Gordonia paraffinivorans]PWD42644.1 exonuclease sbcCD subunit D [Gordonia paraffinivorans]GAC85071.1 nuclease SbcCD subunit D [Gordonia paraffinivorans NBRC 108238]